MGGVPMLLIVAALGVDYGWQPDGGNGVEYVIQVQPDQWDNVKRLGEITSTIDPEVQGRVSKVIIRVGNERLPRITPPLPRSTQTSSYNQLQPNSSSNARTNPSNIVAAVDMVPIPIPEMSDPRRLTPIPGGPDAAAAYGAPKSASMMKPDPASPQGGGFSFPESMQNVASGLKEATQNTIEKVQQNIGAGAPAPISNNPFDVAANELRQQSAAANNAIDQLAQTARNTLAAQGPSTDPVGRTTNRVQPPPFTNPADPTGALARARANGPSTDPAAGRSSNWSPIDSTRDATLAPQSPAGGLGSTGTFGQTPDSLRTMSNSFGGTANAASDNPFGSSTPALTTANSPAADVDYRLSPAQKALLPPGAYSFNEKGIPVDRNWKPIETYNYAQAPTGSSSAYDPNAQAGTGAASIYPAGTNYQNPSNFPLGSASQNWGTSPTAAIAQPASASIPQTTYQGQTPYTAPGPSTPQLTENEMYARVLDRIAQEQLAANRRLAASNSGVLAGNQIPLNNSNRNGTGDQDTFPSSSDLTSGTGGSTITPTSPPSLPGRSTVAAQKLFNVMLLCSIVGNIYLFFWLKNMRDQFRDLVTAKRMSQSSVAA